jgi:transposase-like protein
MPAPYPAEFRRRAVGLARERVKPVARIAEDLGISESCLRRWMAQAEIDEGIREGLTTSEREELRRLRKDNRVLKMERDLLSRAAAFFAAENVLPK